MSKKDPNKKGLFSEFLAFINKGNALAMAVGVILGGAFTAIVTAINKNIISPLIAWAIGDTNLSESVVTILKYREATEADVTNGLAAAVGENVPDIVISWGSLIQAVIDFLLIAVILFLIIKVATSVVNKAKAAQEALMKKDEEPVEEMPIVEEVPAEPKPTTEELLAEIRDLLAANVVKKEE